jgi:hypothetical protein
MGNRFRKFGMHCENNLFNAEINLNGFINEQRTSITQIIISKIGKKNLYNIRNGINISNIFIIASNMLLPAFIFNCGFNTPDGTNNCNLLNIPKRSSGNPEGNGLISGTFNVNGKPNPGIEDPVGPDGDLIETSREHGIIPLILYIGNYLF